MLQYQGKLQKGFPFTEAIEWPGARVSQNKTNNRKRYDIFPHGSHLHSKGKPLAISQI